MFPLIDECDKLDYLRMCAHRYGIRTSRLNKKSIVEILQRSIAAIKIQRCVRSRIGLNDTCPFTLEKFRYPCYGKRVGNGFFYCNLEDLSNFLVTTGDFREPSTRTEYNSRDLDIIESLVKYYKIKLPRSITKSRIDYKSYNKKKIEDEQIDILMERIRFTCWDIREKVYSILSGEYTMNNLLISMNDLHFPEISECMYFLDKKSKRYLGVSIVSARRIIDEIPIDCLIVDKVKKHFYSWLLTKKVEYNLESLEL